jgi:tetratricopeptide (TPR) repeat protein
MLSVRRRLLDIAVFIARHIVDHWWSTESASTRLRTAVDAGRPRIGVKGDAEDQLCVPAVDMQQGRYREARAAAKRHLAIANRAGDKAQTSAALRNLGLVRWDTGEFATSTGFLEQALVTATEAGDRRGVGRVAADLAGLHAEHGDHIRAVEHLQQALKVGAEIGDRWAAAVRVGNLGELYREQGDHVRATRCFAHALGIAPGVG